MRWAFCAALLSCTPEVASLPPQAPEHTVDVMPEGMQRALRRVEALREIKATKPIAGRTVSRGELLKVLRAHVAREIPPEALEYEGVTLKLLGAIPPRYPFVERQFEILGAEIAGLYEPHDKTMYLVSDLSSADAEVTLLHELAHALQDQHFALSSRMRYRKGGSDALSAASALAEGDATYVMLRASGAVPAPASMNAAMSREAKKEDRPPFLSRSLVASYVYGYEFVFHLSRQGGMDAVNAAWKRPPSTTEQILHVDKWSSNEPALKVDAPALAHAVEEDSFGEMTLRAYLELAMPEADAAVSASGWGGDRSALSIDGDVAQFAWHYRADANAPEAPLRVYAGLKRVLATMGRVEETGDTACVERPQAGPLLVKHIDEEVWLTAGPTSIRSWLSLATCKDARVALNALMQTQTR